MLINGIKYCLRILIVWPNKVTIVVVKSLTNVFISLAFGGVVEWHKIVEYQLIGDIFLLSEVAGVEFKDDDRG